VTKILANEDGENWGAGRVDYDNPGQYDCCGRAGAHPQDGGCRGPTGYDRGADGPAHRLCSVNYAGVPAVFVGYNAEVLSRAFEAKGANGSGGFFADC